MKFIAARDMRNRPGEVWSALEEDDVVLTQHGKPVALMTRVGEDDLELKLAALRRAHLARALDRIREAAVASGADGLTDDEIDCLVAEVRSERRAR